MEQDASRIFALVRRAMSICMILLVMQGPPLCLANKQAESAMFLGSPTHVKAALGTQRNMPARNDPERHNRPLQWDVWNGAASMISVVGAILANAAGVGGGGMFVPMFNILLGFDTKTATALSQAMITGGAFTSFLYNLRLQHPTQHRPLIDYNIALLLEPMLLLGISVGVIFNIVFPSWLINVLLMLLLFYMSWRTTTKGISTWQQETRTACEELHSRQMVTVAHPVTPALQHGQGGDRQLEEGDRSHSDEHASDLNERRRAYDEQDEERVEPASAEVSLPRVVVSTSRPRAGSSEVPFLHKTNEQLQNLKALVMKEMSIIPKWRLVEVLLIWLVFLTLQIFKGGRTKPSLIGVRSCEHWFWVLVVLQVPLCAVSTLWVASRLAAEHRNRVGPGGESYVAGDVHWGRHQLLLYPLLALAAGAMAGLLGIGGGMVIGPILLEMGVLPQVAAATGALMVLFSSSMAVAQFGILSLIPLNYALYYGGICAVAGCVGLVLVRVLIRKYGRTSIIIFALAAVIASSALIIAVTGSMNISDQVHNHEYMGFQSLCGSS